MGVFGFAGDNNHAKKVFSGRPNGSKGNTSRYIYTSDTFVITLLLQTVWQKKKRKEGARHLHVAYLTPVELAVGLHDDNMMTILI